MVEFDDIPAISEDVIAKSIEAVSESKKTIFLYQQYLKPLTLS